MTLSKAVDIEHAISTKDLSALREAAISENGLVNDTYRRSAWPILCGVSEEPSQISADRSFFDSIDPETQYTDHPDFSVITADVHRSVMWFDEAEDTEDLKIQLTRVIMAVLLRDPQLCYFQGYNVVCAVIFRVTGNDSFRAFRLAKAITAVHFRHLMLDRKGEKMWDFLSYIFPIIGRVNYPLRTFLESADLRETVCISWILTWLGYHIGSVSLEEICRMFDFFLSTNDRYMPLYFSASLILYHADGITNCQPEMTEVFQYVKSIPESIPIEKIILDSLKLREQVPLDSVEEDARKLIQSRAEQTMLLRNAVKRNQGNHVVRYSGLWRLGYSLYQSQQARALAASTVALGIAFIYARNPDAINNVYRILRRCTNSLTLSFIGMDVDLLLG